MKNKNIHLIGYAAGIGSHNPGCSFGPVFLQGEDLTSALAVDHQWQAMLYAKSAQSKLAALEPITEVCRRLAEITCELTTQRQFFITIGGDHTCAIGSWSGTAAALRQQGDLGLIWIDAHMDSHTFGTTETGNIHGMPLAVLLGRGEPALTQIIDVDPKLKPENVCIIGVRSYESGEAELLRELNVRTYFMEEIKERGLAPIMQEAIKQVKKNTCAYGLSLDLDAIDPIDAPAIGSPEKDGIRAADLLTTLKFLQNDPRLAGVDIAEFNPNLDIKDKTKNIIIKIINTIFSAGAHP